MRKGLLVMLRGACGKAVSYPASDTPILNADISTITEAKDIPARLKGGGRTTGSRLADWGHNRDIHLDDGSPGTKVGG